MERTMKTIKFRGRDERGYWHIGWLVETNDGGIYIAENDEGWTDDGFHNDDFSGWYNVLEKTIGQFTGLLDKNGKEIYEGDIVKFTKWDGKLVKGLVKWDDSNPCMCIEFKTEYKQTDWEYDFIKCGTMKIEVIGNIHDNPELLKGGKNE
jgi:uncharacterized phage protein (TIGR01671 family)